MIEKDLINYIFILKQGDPENPKQTQQQRKKIRLSSILEVEHDDENEKLEASEEQQPNVSSFNTFFIF